MTVSEIKNEIMFQTNNDTDDLGDFLPYLMDYINEGYDRLVYAFAQVHLKADTDYVNIRSAALSKRSRQRSLPRAARTEECGTSSIYRGKPWPDIIR